MINEGNDFIFFGDIQDMAAFMEPWQLENDDETLYLDSRQHLLKFTIDKGEKEWLWQGKVVYGGLDQVKKIEVDLRSRLAKYISKRTGDESFLDASWDSLISFVEEHLLPRK